MDSCEFETLLARINQESTTRKNKKHRKTAPSYVEPEHHQTHTDKSWNKLEILFTSRGFFTAHQASRIIYALGHSVDKLKALEIMEPRLCRMTSSESRDIIGAFHVQADKVKALEHIKRYITDYQEMGGVEYIVSAYPFEGDKIRAVNVLRTVRSDVADLTPAGGHQGYAALGGLYTQARPMVPHIYGSVEAQKSSMPGGGEVTLPAHAMHGEPSAYGSHPSYSFQQGRDYAEDRGYPGNPAYNESFGTYGECSARPPMPTVFDPIR